MECKELAALEEKVKEQQAIIEVMKECFVTLGVSPSVFEVLQDQSQKTIKQHSFEVNFGKASREALEEARNTIIQREAK